MINSFRPRQHGRRFADDTFKCIFLAENVIIVIETSLKFVPNDLINNIPALVEIMAWRRPGDKPLPQLMVIRLSRPQWVNELIGRLFSVFRHVYKLYALLVLYNTYHSNRNITVWYMHRVPQHFALTIINWPGAIWRWFEHILLTISAIMQ